MKITAILLFAFCMQLSATVRSQITLSEKDAPLTKILEKIQEQSGYNLFYKDNLINDNKLNIKIRNVSLEQALNEVFRQQNLTFELVKNTIVVRKKEENFIDKIANAFAQEDAEGVVLDEKGNPLAGATVRVKGTKNSVITDVNGHFHLIRPDFRDRLIISYVGYQDKEIAIEAKMTVKLELKSAELNEVVVAYGRQEQKAITGAVTVVKGEQIQNLPNRSVDKSLQGLVPGLVVTKGSGQPGGNVSNFILRGIATGGDPSLGNPVRNPLFVIDGIPVTQESAMRTLDRHNELVSNPLAHLNPSDIETISVLKDASAIALYGSKASNGVILVTTKRGKAGKTQYNFRHQTEIANREDNGVKLLNQQQYIDLFVETYQNSFPDATRADVIDLLKIQFPVQSNGDFYPEVNWVDAISNKNALTSANELSASGGNENSNFYINFERTDQKGVIKRSGYERTSFRLNFENIPLGWLKYGINTSLSHNIQNFQNIGMGISAKLVRNSANMLTPYSAVK
ncbi:SusC/RagA family TonB-linked outer membrane protein [Pedobacter faecalis]|uniref:SusC/RagA family TonB-linked outer membrane protein n=1 Tax=Pedobacter faecalis TaxID=3041495 RepID=UPI00254D7B1F|nr:SusC/RagA family TonB-linked outer membrane protein [Pedobacter sp. ELA7]